MPRAGAAAAVSDGFLYVMGGVTGDDFTASTELAQIQSDGSVGPWRPGPPMNEPREFFDAVVNRGYLYVIGGGQGENGHILLSTVERARVLPGGGLGPWDRLDVQAGSTGLLPPVLPLVVYHGAAQWSHEPRFSALLDASDELKLRLLDFPYGLVDVGQIDDAAISQHAVLRAGLLLLKYALKDLEATRALPVLVALLRAVASGPERIWLLSVRHIGAAYRNLDEAVLREAIHRAMPEQEEQIMSTLAEKWMEQGVAKGLEQGLEQG